MNYDAVFKQIDNILWKYAGCDNDIDYVEQTTWILFLKYLDLAHFTRAQRPEVLHCLGYHAYIHTYMHIHSSPLSWVPRPGLRLGLG